MGEPYFDNEIRLIYLRHCLEGFDTFDLPVFLDIAKGRPDLYQVHLAARADGNSAGRWPEDIGFYHTMIGRQRLDNVHSCLDTIRQEGIAGDLIECGVWRGGTVVFMRGYLAAYDLRDRAVLVADSFAGLPKPAAVDEGLDLSPDVVPILAIERRRVEEVFRAYDLLDERVRFLEGWFADTLPAAEFANRCCSSTATLHSRRDALVACYTAAGGVIDDYGAIPQCARVVDFRGARHYRRRSHDRLTGASTGGNHGPVD